MHICEFCGKQHDGSYGSGRFCSAKCSRKYSNTFVSDKSRKNQIKALIDPKNREKGIMARKSGNIKPEEYQSYRKPVSTFGNSFPFSKMMLGEIGELRTAEEFGKRGFHVYMPVFHDSPIDMIVNIDGKLKRIQVKSTTISDGNVSTFQLESTNAKHSKGVDKYYRKKYSADEIDYFALYDYNDDEVYLLKNDSEKGTINLRKSKPKNNNSSTINYKSDHSFDRMLSMMITDTDPDDVIDDIKYDIKDE